MPSPTQQTRKRRQRKRSKQGSARKRALAKRGTTPVFPVHPEPSASETTDQK